MVGGFKAPSRARDVQRLIGNSNVGLVGLLEIKGKAAKYGRIVNRMNPNWVWIDNYSCDISGRVNVGWDPMR